MYFAISCRDKADHMSLRMENRPAHIEYLKAHTDKILVAGPTLGDTPDQMTGSLLIMEFDSLADAQNWAANDPYAVAGLFETSSVLPWKKVIPA